MPFRLARPNCKKIVAFFLAFLLLSLGVFCVGVWWRAHRALREAEQIAITADQVAVYTVPMRASRSEFEPVLTTAGFRSAAEFQGDLYVCTKSALHQYSHGEPKRSWRVGLELPPYPLQSLAIRTGIGTPELWIATDGAGLIIYDGNRFRQLVPQKTALHTITCMLPLRNGQMLIGTKTGLYATDGQTMRIFHAQFAKTDITALAGDEDQFWVGTRADGAWLWRGGEAVHLSAGLPDPQVLSLCARREQAWIGTPLGIAEFANGKLSRRLADGVFAQAVAENKGMLWIGTVDEGTLNIPLAARVPRPEPSGHSENLQNTLDFAQLGEEFAAITPQRISALPDGETIIKASNESLASEHITAIHADGQGRLWVGYFDRGIDIVDLKNRALPHHLEDDVLFCINRIKENPANGTVAVGTANGLALFDAAANLRQVLDRKTGLIASHVTDILFRENSRLAPSLAIATPAGISFSEDGAISSVYAFHGLVNNHVYTLARLDGTLYAGTLGGLSALKNGLVEASFTTANSKLRQNWITASAVFDGKLYVGTYGSGVVGFEKNGTIASFPAFAGRRFEVNANAMLATSRALYAGIAGHGLAVLRHGDEPWQFIGDGLPSLNVTALEERDGTLLVGTDNGLVRVPENKLLP